MFPITDDSMEPKLAWCLAPAQRLVDELLRGGKPIPRDFEAAVASLTKGYEAAKNRALATILLFIRQALANSDHEDLTQAQMKTLETTLSSLISTPVISLRDAAVHRKNLSLVGWRGDCLVVSKLLSEVAQGVITTGVR